MVILRIAIFEGRPLFYMVIIYLLVTNLLSTRRQYVRLVMMVMVAISIQSVFSLLYYRTIPGEERAVMESLSEHSATIPMNGLFVLLICSLVFRCSRWMRWTLLLLAIPVTWAYVLSQRRAAMVALGAGVVIILAVLFDRRRRAFWFVTPTLLVLTVGFVGATWNATGALGLMSNATKTVFFPDQLGEAESSSDIYRELEKFNLAYTIESNRLFGRGFGNKFFRPAPMPDISFFEFWEYIPHNNVLWIWIKMGFFGFVSMLYLFGRAVQLGARSITVIRSSDHVAIALVGLTYVVMFLVFSYVDIAYDPRSTVFLGVAIRAVRRLRAGVRHRCRGSAHQALRDGAAVRTRVVLGVALAGVLLAAACSGSGEDDIVLDSSPATTTSAAIAAGSGPASPPGSGPTTPAPPDAAAADVTVTVDVAEVGPVISRDILGVTSGGGLSTEDMHAAGIDGQQLGWQPDHPVQLRARQRLQPRVRLPVPQHELRQPARPAGAGRGARQPGGRDPVAPGDPDARLDRQGRRRRQLLVPGWARGLPRPGGRRHVQGPEGGRRPEPDEHPEHARDGAFVAQPDGRRGRPPGVRGDGQRARPVG